jgi:hypothetical protein
MSQHHAPVATLTRIWSDWQTGQLLGQAIVIGVGTNVAPQAVQSSGSSSGTWQTGQSFMV